eukprot:SAG11_NODE_234_length_11857_cov_15.265776_6_plen_106_part_00
MARPLQEYMSSFRRCVEVEEVDVKELRQLTIEGIPEELKLRGLFWQLLLGYLPMDRSRWAETRRRKRRAYQVSANPVVSTAQRVHPDGGKQRGVPVTRLLLHFSV